ncbi:LPS export ABC transporter permease LptG [Thioalkalivibrio denitrificans]|uniref:LPS export ABC transporter permease LptG n=1 Tax=Thioalkalivibrio denitrificans TaxID=108003 RepID=A0A1V3NFG0_9GAMM|nr:LPS export ABC transporter permease LptG [Thioalkalivibrio denitrificans]OOG23837.1 LPS export ABC transporter permease LptG [Thioalkalivibrio denitrificans]
MRRLDGYIGRQVAVGTLLVLLVLTGLDALFAFIGEIDGLDEHYGLVQALVYTALTVPRRAYELFPTAVLLGSLLSLGTLAANSELIAMRAAGVSVARIVGSALRTGLILMVGIVIVGEGVAPAGEQRGQNLRAMVHSDEMHVTTRGLWAKDGQRFVNVGAVMPDLRLLNVRIYELDADRRLSALMRVEAARYEGGRWMLSGIHRSRLSDAGVTSEFVDEERWSRLLAPELFDVLAVEPRQMSAMTLRQYVNYLRENNLESAQYELAYWMRFTIPLSSLVMLLLAIPFVFGSLRTGSAGQRLFIGVLIGVGFHLLNRTFNHMGIVYGLPPLLSASLPMLIFLGVALAALRRVR